jgi:predicted nucleic acid-binding protein
VIVADTSGLLALFNGREPAHDAVARVVEAEREPMIVSPYVVAELDYLLATRAGVEAELTLLRELSGGAYHLANLDEDGLAACASVVERYGDQQIGVADASIVVLAARHQTRRILTLDHRHFSVVRPLDGGRFRLLPG